MPTIILPKISSEVIVRPDDMKYPIFFQGLVGAWSAALGFTGFKAIDYSGNRKHGSILLFPTTIWKKEKCGYSWNFNSTNTSSRRIDLPNSGKNYNEFTIIAWVRHISSSNGIFSTGNNHSLWIDGINTISYGNPLGVNMDTFVGTITDGLIHQLVITSKISGSNFTAKCFYDGKERATSTFSLTPQFDNWKIGTFSSSTNSYNGDIIECKFYSRILSPQEIYLEYKLGPGKWTKLKNKYINISPSQISTITSPYDFRVIRGQHNQLFTRFNNRIY